MSPGGSKWLSGRANAPTSRRATLDQGFRGPTTSQKCGFDGFPFTENKVISFKMRLLEVPFIESFNGRLRDDCLNVHQFTLLSRRKPSSMAWRVNYNTRRPHSSLGHSTPNEFGTQRQKDGPLKTSSSLASRCLKWGHTSRYQNFSFKLFP